MPDPDSRGSPSEETSVEVSNNPLHRLVGGWRGGLESAAPSVLFVIIFLTTRNILAAVITALIVALAMAALRLIQRERPIRVLAGLLAVSVAALVAAVTGNAVDYFLPSLLANLASFLVWGISILIGWPLLGVIMGFLLRQRTQWRSDPDLVRAYSRASWIWAVSFLVRGSIQGVLWWSDSVFWLGVARVVLGWPMVALVITLSWWTIRRTLPKDHPGLLHPRSDSGTA